MLHRSLGLVLAITIAAATSGGLGVSRAHASALSVNTTTDAVDTAPGNGVCETTVPHQCTLRAAVQEANAFAGADTITLPAGTFTLSIAGAGENAGASGDLDLTSEMNIIGAGAGSTIVDGGGLDRVFEVDPFASGTVFAGISNITITNGSASRGGGLLNHGGLDIANSVISANDATDDGGGVYNAVGAIVTMFGAVIELNTAAPASGLGGGIANAGELELYLVDLRQNTAGASGGGIHNSGNLLIDTTAISSNEAMAQHGGGIANEISGSAILQNSTIDANNAGTSGGGVYSAGGLAAVNVTLHANQAGVQGAAITNDAGGSAAVRNTTIAGNTAPAADAVWNAGAIDMMHTILAGDGTGNCWNTGASFLSLGHNIDDGASCGFAADGDLSATNPMLGPLQENGGFTKTRALLPDSAAVDAGSSGGCVDHAGDVVVLDQRGAGRPYDGNGDGTPRCDIGAFESQVVDSDGDGIADATDNCPYAANPSQQDNDASGGWPWIRDGTTADGATLGGDACDVDDDNDGCSDAEEGGGDPHQGGARDPLLSWDVFDVPTPVLLPIATGGLRSGSTGITDVLAILAYAGTVNNGSPIASGADYDSDLNANGVEDGAEYDRSPSTIPGETWHSGPPSGGVSLIDALVALAQAGTSCAGA